MGEMSLEVLGFLLKSVVVLGVIIAAAVAIATIIAVASSGRRRAREESDLDLVDLAEHQRAQRAGLLSAILSRKALRKIIKSSPADPSDEVSRLFVIGFKGDREANALKALRQEIAGILLIARPGIDEVAVRLESPGGSVVQYGHAASQLVRLREAGLQLTVLVDEVAASGGYLMAAVAHRIIAAPFAAVGSIGVLIQIPNVARWLKERQIDMIERTAGTFKRTVSILGEIKPEGLTKLDEQLQDTHVLFQQAVLRYRPHLDVSRVATGEYWYGTQALGLGLVDALGTSDEFIDQQRSAGKRVFFLRSQRRENWYQRFGSGLAILVTSFRSGVERSEREFRADLKSPTPHRD